MVDVLPFSTRRMQIQKYLQMRRVDPLKTSKDQHRVLGRMASVTELWERIREPVGATRSRPLRRKQTCGFWSCRRAELPHALFSPSAMTQLSKLSLTHFQQSVQTHSCVPRAAQSLALRVLCNQKPALCAKKHTSHHDKTAAAWSLMRMGKASGHIKYSRFVQDKRSA